jgi:hypothetical protein
MENSYRNEPGKSPGRMKVVCPVEKKDGKTRWVGVGSAFTNKDQSINIYLDVLPVNGRLQLREWEDSPPWERNGDRGHRHAGGGERAMALPFDHEPAASGAGNEIPF